MIGNAHIDPVWLWCWQEGFSEVRATFRSALDRLDEFPEFIFTCAGAAYYQWIEDCDPAMFEEIRQRVAEGRWVIVGGWWVQPDCNIPSGESFARHALISQRYFLSRFGKMAQVGYNVDSFGHHAMLPQIIARSGMSAYVMMRPGQHEMKLPASLFRWQSPDGTEIAAFRIPINYASWWGEPDPLLEKTKAVLALADQEDTDFMNFYGVGNHGGGPTIQNILTIKAMQAQFTPDEILFSSPDAFFADIRGILPKLPVVSSELQHHGSGCYAAHSETKASNRRAEHRAIQAEIFSALAYGLARQPYPQKKLARSWQKILFNQFHDIMGGCSIKEVYRDVAEFYGQSLTESAEAMNAALQAIAWSVDTHRDGITALSRDQDWLLWEMQDHGVPVILFNSLAWPVKQTVQFNRKLAAVTGPDGKLVPIQYVRAPRLNAADRWDTLFMAEVPAMGYCTYWVFTGRMMPAGSADDDVTAADCVLENRQVRVVFDPETGAVAQMIDLSTGRNVLGGLACTARVVDESGLDTWGHDRKDHILNVLTYDQWEGAFSDPQITVLEKGPLRAVIRVVSSFGRSELQQDFILHAGSADLEVKVRLNWREEQKMLKLCFPVAGEALRALYEIPFGVLERPADGREQPGQQWFALAGEADGSTAGACGLAVINDGKYSFSAAACEMRMIAARSPVYAMYESEVDAHCEYLDQGIQEFRYSLIPLSENVGLGDVARKAWELNAPLQRVTGTYHAGTMPQVFQGIEVDNRDILITAFKRSEDLDGYILRFHEISGRTGQVHISLPFLDRAWSTLVKPFEIRTIHIPDHDNLVIQEVNLIEMQEEKQDETEGNHSKSYRF